MSQMQQNEEYGYGRYEGARQYDDHPPQQQYGGAVDDNFVEAVAQRIVQRIPVGVQGKLVTSSNRPGSGQRLALAIVSLALLAPLAGIIFGILHASFLAVVVFGITCAAVVLVNGIFNYS
jgi:hypothetical protein